MVESCMEQATSMALWWITPVIQATSWWAVRPQPAQNTPPGATWSQHASVKVGIVLNNLYVHKVPS